MKLFWKFFFFFFVAMTLTVVMATILSFRVAQQATDQLNVENREQIIGEAAEALALGGEPSLRAWLAHHPRPAPGYRVIITDEQGRDLLDREIPEGVREMLVRSAMRPDNVLSNVRRLRMTANLIGDNGQIYPMLFMRVSPTILGILIWPGTQVSVLSSAIVAAAITALLLARYLSSPIVKLQQASRALAAGALNTRVGGPFDRRGDEVGTLARDFDKMAAKLQAMIIDKETLLRDVSHELRSPLARMRVGLALAQRKANPESQRDLDRLEQEVERLDELVGQVMTLSRLRTPNVGERRAVDLNALLGEVVENARFEHPGAVIRFDCPPVPSIMGNPDELYSAIENVVRNALTHSGETPAVDIELHASDERIALSVADRGPGVPDALLDRIFEPFYQTDTSRDHQRSGQGIGLSIAASVLERHGGHIRARNRPGGGLEVTLELPAAST